MVNARLCAVVPGNCSTLAEHSEEPGSLDMVIQGDNSCYNCIDKSLNIMQEDALKLFDL